MSKRVISSQHSTAHGDYRSYVTGFVLSLTFTLIPYVIVVEELMSGVALAFVLVGFALIQLMVQLRFFIHLGHENGPRWNLVAFLFMVLVVGIVVGGSLWIMHNLNYNMMPDEMDHYMHEQQNSGGF